MKKAVMIISATLNMVAMFSVLIVCACGGGGGGSGSPSGGGSVIYVNAGESIQEAINAAENGDTIKLSAGTWNEKLVIGKNINLIGQGSGQTTIDGTDFSSPYISPKHVILLQEEMTNGEISNITIKDNGTSLAATCLIATVEDEPYRSLPKAFRIENNVFEGGEIVCMVFSGNVSPEIVGNLFLGPSQWCIVFNGADSHYTISPIIEKNIFMNYSGVAIHMEEGGLFAVTIMNNYIHDCYTAIYLGHSVTSNDQSANIMNNTIAFNDNGIWAWSDFSGNIKNNIVVHNSNSGIYIGGTPTATIDYNNVWNNSGCGDYCGLSAGANDLSEDPLFMNPNYDNFHLDANSPCIDKGTSTDAPVEDFDGDARPQGLEYDIGADEY